MNKTVEKFKNKTKQYAPAVMTGAVFGAAVSALVVHRIYNPKDKIAIQFPEGVMETMRDEGTGIALNTNEGWFTLKYHPQD